MLYHLQFRFEQMLMVQRLITQALEMMELLSALDGLRMELWAELSVLMVMI